MAKKFINGENLVYALGQFEQQIMDKVEKITDFAQAQNTDIDKIFAQVEEDIKNDNNEQNK